MLSLKNHIGALEHERSNLLNLIDNYKYQLGSRGSGVIVETRGQSSIYSNQ